MRNCEFEHLPYVHFLRSKGKKEINFFRNEEKAREIFSKKKRRRCFTSEAKKEKPKKVR